MLTDRAVIFYLNQTNQSTTLYQNYNCIFDYRPNLSCYNRATMLMMTTTTLQLVIPSLDPNNVCFCGVDIIPCAKYFQVSTPSPICTCCMSSTECRCLSFYHSHSVSHPQSAASIVNIEFICMQLSG